MSTDTTTQEQTALRTLAPPMPEKIRSMIHEEWSDLDAEADKMLGFMKKARVFHEFAHGRSTFMEHLRGTWSILACWDQPEAVCRCGLLHSAYTRQGFYFRFFDILDDESRKLLMNVVGKDAESQIYKYCAGEVSLSSGLTFCPGTQIDLILHYCNE